MYNTNNTPYMQPGVPTEQNPDQMNQMADRISTLEGNSEIQKPNIAPAQPPVSPNAPAEFNEPITTGRFSDATQQAANKIYDTESNRARSVGMNPTELPSTPEQGLAGIASNLITQSQR